MQELETMGFQFVSRPEAKHLSMSGRVPALRGMIAAILGGLTATGRGRADASTLLSVNGEHLTSQHTLPWTFINSINVSVAYL